eukprot:TRINITY_DN32803_c0_g4_i3.p1 TRINITY_DN32803_c0_g4~~TRINITY_DN32803_c0_g4_i3.p1  ORF type:complete len:107 (+),score=6.18 TRINITY_DN32803_c0_g4_i3:97-417(+)
MYVFEIQTTPRGTTTRPGDCSAGPDWQMPPPRCTSPWPHRSLPKRAASAHTHDKLPGSGIVHTLHHVQGLRFAAHKSAKVVNPRVGYIIISIAGKDVCPLDGVEPI